MSDHLNNNQMIIFLNIILDIKNRLMLGCDAYFEEFLF